jgi:uncharacterized protein YjbI with pentapeptide repeats
MANLSGTYLGGAYLRKECLIAADLRSRVVGQFEFWTVNELGALLPKPIVKASVIEKNLTLKALSRA